MPGRVWVRDCECPEVVIDWEARTIFHPHLGCPFYGRRDTPLDITDTKPL